MIDKFCSYSETREILLSGKMSCKTLVGNYLKRIVMSEEQDIFVEVFPNILERASLIDEKISKGKAGKLAGMIVAIKSNICHKGSSVTTSSETESIRHSSYSATVIERLLEQDAIIIGRVNADDRYFNNHNASLFCNDKSSFKGPAAAVSSGLCMAAISSDSSGTIRMPASKCGIFGLRPTYGSVSRHGFITLNPSYDQIGPITSSFQDLKKMTEVIVNNENEFKDDGISRLFSKRKNRREKLKIACLKDFLYLPALNDKIRNRVEKLSENLTNKGIQVDMLDFGFCDDVLPVYYILSSGESNSILANSMPHQHSSAIETSEVADFESYSACEYKKMILTGTYILTNEKYRPYYSQANKIRKSLMERMTALFVEYDFVMLPVAPNENFSNHTNNDPLSLMEQDRFTVLASLTGLPAISIPIGIESGNSYYGIQIMGPSFSENVLLENSENIQQEAAKLLNNDKKQIHENF